MVLIAHHLLESSIGAYIEWLVNELMMTANKIEYKDARLVMLPTDVITHKLDSLIGDRRILRANTYVWKPPGGLNEDFLNVADIEFI